MGNKLKIIGLAGTNGSGKDTIGKIVADKYGYLFVSVTDLLRAEAERRGQLVEREVLRTISAEWRRELGLGVLVDKAVAEYEIAKDKYTGVVIASLRNPGEADRVHALSGIVVWVDADLRVRYDRVQAAIAERGRPGEDAKTFEQFQAEEVAEMKQEGDAATLDMQAVKERCDVFVNNNGEPDELRKRVEQALNLSPQDTDRTGNQ